ncbi:MAG: S8/S53 family peptidase [Gaiellaceae bacterium]
MRPAREDGFDDHLRAATPKADPRAVRINLLVEGASVGDAPVVREAAAALGPDGAGRPWRFERLFEPVDDDEENLGRFFVVSGFVNAFELPAVGWEAAYSLARELPSEFHVEPDLPSLVGVPEPPPFLATAEAAPTAYDWAIESLHCRDAWSFALAQARPAKGEGIVIAHPDTGYVIHPEFPVEGLDLSRDTDILSGDDDALDPLERFSKIYFPGHGTRTGSAIVGRESGVLVGAAPAATLIPIRTVKSVIQIGDADVARAVNYARTVGCHVVSMSLGGAGFIGLEAAINRAVRDGVIVLAAAGNFVPFGLIVWPARYRNCVAISASTSARGHWQHGSRGAKVVVAAPGQDVYVPDIAYKHDPPVTTSSGTSYGVAHVAGLATLWLAFHGRENLIAELGRENLQSAFVVCLEASAHEPKGWNRDYGSGIADAHALLRAALPSRAELAEPELAEAGIESRAEQLYELVPHLSRTEVEERLARELGVSTERVRQLIRIYGAELFHLIAATPGLWLRLGGERRPVREEAAASPVLLGRASAELTLAVLNG